jgi:ATP phosphoribosyltransferase
MMRKININDFDAGGAERIGVPKGDDNEACIEAFQEATDIEVPRFDGFKLSAVSEGREFFLLKGRDIPGLAAAGLVDLGVAGTDNINTCTVGSGPAVPNLQYLKVGRPMCCLVLMAEEGKKGEMEARLWSDPRYPSGVMPVATPLPWIVNYQAAALDLPIRAVELPPGVSVTGSMEIAPRLLKTLGVELIADRVQSGRTSLENGLARILPMLDIYPALVGRIEDEDL